MILKNAYHGDWNKTLNLRVEAYSIYGDVYYGKKIKYKSLENHIHLSGESFLVPAGGKTAKTCDHS